MTSLTIFSTDANVQQEWQAYLPDSAIYLTDEFPTREDIWVLDCRTLSVADCQHILARCATCCFAWVDAEQLAEYGTVFFQFDVPLLQRPLTAFGVETVRQALHSQQATQSPEQQPHESYTQLTRAFVRHARTPSLLIESVATTVRDTLGADWVAFISVAIDETDDFRVELLGSAGMTQEDIARHIIRPNGLTLHIMKTAEPLIISDMAHFEQDHLQINPLTLKAGFEAGMVFPLLADDGVPFGVVWVLYHQVRTFSDAEAHHMQVYANHVALAYQYGVQKKLVDQWQKASERIFTHFDYSLSLTSTLQHITDGIHESLDCDVVTLYVYDADSQTVGVPYQQGAQHRQAIHQEGVVASDSIVYAMLDLSVPLILENAPADARFARTAFLHREGVQSLVVMPLRRAHKRVGVVFLNYRQPRHFLHDERAAIERLAEQIAVPVLNACLDEERRKTTQENSELLEQIREQGEQLQNLVKVIDIERNLSNQDRDAILDTIARSTARAAGADRITIRLIRDDGVRALAVYPQSSNNPDDWEIREGGHSQYIVETNNPVIIADVDQYDPSEYGGIQINPHLRNYWKARIGLPLTSGETTIGVMWLSFKHPQRVNETQLSALQSFANIAFLTKMYDIEQERLQHALKVMSSAHQSIHEATETDTILQRTMHLARQIVSSRAVNDACRSHLAVIHNNALIFKPEHNDPATYRLLQNALAPDATLTLDDETSLVLSAVQDQRTVLVNDVAQDPRFRPLLHDAHAGSQLSVPIYIGDEVFGVVSVEHRLPNSFEWYDQATLEWLASFVGQVLRNHKQQQMREALLEASQAITEGRDLSAVLQAIAEHAHKVLRIKREATDHDAYVGLREEDQYALVFHAGYPQHTIARIRAVGLDRIDLRGDLIGVSGIALTTNQPQLVLDTRTAKQAFQVEADTYPPLSILSLPIPNLTEDRPAVGVISLGHRQANSFDKDDRDIMMLFAKFAAVAIRRAREIDAQNRQRESLFELTHAAMHQVIASHDLNNFRMIYNFEFSQLQTHVSTFLKREEDILKSINDSQVFDEIAEAMDAVQENIRNLDEAYHSLIDHETHVPELGEQERFLLREWLWQYHKEKNVYLQLDPSLSDAHRCPIPRYWLREVLKIVLDNARRSLKQSGYDINKPERLIQMQASFDEQSGQVVLTIANPGKHAPLALRSLLTHRVIPRHLRKEGGGRGIGLFMSGIILRAYQGDIQYLPQTEHPTFKLLLPVH
ncbi:MAG: GAF domain-containing protein [Anaerolineae bacterium]